MSEQTIEAQTAELLFAVDGLCRMIATAPRTTAAAWEIRQMRDGVRDAVLALGLRASEGEHARDEYARAAGRLAEARAAEESARDVYQRTGADADFVVLRAAGARRIHAELDVTGAR